MLDRILSSEMRFTLADNDLPKVCRSCELAGVEVAYPLLSDELIAFAARLPEQYKVKGLKLRWFFKHALRDFLPEEILHKRKHGFGLPFGVWLQTRKPLMDLTRESLDGLRQRGIVRAGYVDELTELHRSEHAIYYGVQLWNFMMLEQWFRTRDEQMSFA